MIRATMVREIQTEPWGACELFVVRGGDGRPELLWVQTKGIFHSSIYTEHLGRFAYLRQEDRDLWCVTATGIDGRPLWQNGTPHTRDTLYCCHTAEGMVSASETVDGEIELFCLAGENRLAVLDGATGRVKRSRRMPADNYSVVRVGCTGPGQRTVLAQVSERAYPPHEYGNPVMFLSEDLETIAEMDVTGSGHCPVVFDADGDGWDEFLIGYSLFDHDMSPVWSLTWWQDHEYDDIGMHVDSVQMHWDDSGDWQAAIAGSDALYFVSSSGEMLWRREGPHPQHCLIGRFDGGAPAVFVLNQRLQMDLYSLEGELLWNGLLPENWPLGVPPAVREKRRFHMGIPATLWRNPLGNGEDLIVYNEAGWPYAVNGRGERVVEFPCPEASRQDDLPEVPSHRADDYGLGYRAAVLDADGDGVEEVLIYDRRHAWLFKCALSDCAPRDNQDSGGSC